MCTIELLFSKIVVDVDFNKAFIHHVLIVRISSNTADPIETFARLKAEVH